jgi:NAD(P)-dependent dehydrogenase (short-subunit alcohol dehydrogenase family)
MPEAILIVKTTVIRMAFALSQELRGRGVTAVAVTPGFLRSERRCSGGGRCRRVRRRARARRQASGAHSRVIFQGVLYVTCVYGLFARYEPNFG